MFDQAISSAFTKGDWARGVGLTAVRGAGDAAVGGGISEFTGGNFKDGFIGSGVSSVLSPAFGAIPGLNQTVAGRTAVAAVIGGTASELTGGKFANGAMSAAFTHLFNELAVISRWASLDDHHLGPFGEGPYNMVAENPSHWMEMTADQMSAFAASQRSFAGTEYVFVWFDEITTYRSHLEGIPGYTYYDTMGQQGYALWVNGDGNVVESWLVSSGGVTQRPGLSGTLNRIPNGDWYAYPKAGGAPSYPTPGTEDAFTRNGYRFKFDIPTPGVNRSNILFHPTPGYTEGCIGLTCGRPALESFSNRIGGYLTAHSRIPVIVR